MTSETAWELQDECAFEYPHGRCPNPPFAVISVIKFVDYVNTGSGFAPMEPTEPWYMTVCTAHYQPKNMAIVELADKCNAVAVSMCCRTGTA